MLPPGVLQELSNWQKTSRLGPPMDSPLRKQSDPHKTNQVIYFSPASKTTQIFSIPPPPTLLPMTVPISLTSSQAISPSLIRLQPHSLPCCFTDVPRSLPAWGLCTCCSLCLGCCSSRSLNGWLFIRSHLECHLHREALQSCSFTPLSFTLITALIH